MHRGLDGAKLGVDSDHGVVTINGKVMNDSQRDMAVALVRTIDGVRQVRAEVERE